MPRTILITGASSGIGRCAALMFRDRGWRVFATARKDEDLEALEAENVTPIRLELADTASVQSTAAQVLNATGGRLDALFNNGAYGQSGAIEDLSRRALEEQFATNLFGTVELTNAVLPAMRANGHGRIVMNSSVLGLVSLAYRGAYNASKYALEGVCDTLRLELKGSGIHVCLVEPGPILSRFRANSYLAFQRHIDAEASVHRDRYRAMRERLNTKGAAVPFTLPPEAVVKKVIHAVESRSPRPRYYVTFPTYLFGLLRRVLSTRMLDRLLARV
ncbi:MAG: SDR family NAD(P)-dependent oxidoreductase [Nitrospirota bacterium]|nr:SDR family NAD(P)-dependent oxidoreductase [Nitrospirota bacterium]